MTCKCEELCAIEQSRGKEQVSGDGRQRGEAAAGDGVVREDSAFVRWR